MLSIKKNPINPHGDRTRLAESFQAAGQVYRVTHTAELHLPETPDQTLGFFGGDVLKGKSIGNHGVYHRKNGGGFFQCSLWSNPGNANGCFGCLDLGTLFEDQNHCRGWWRCILRFPKPRSALGFTRPKKRGIFEGNHRPTGRYWEFFHAQYLYICKNDLGPVQWISFALYLKSCSMIFDIMKIWYFIIFQ